MDHEIQVTDSVLIVLWFNDTPILVAILCRLPEKGRKEIAEEMKERNSGERGAGMKLKKQNKNIPPLPLPATGFALGFFFLSPPFLPI